jgi:FixJ family two-component response regulator
MITLDELTVREAQVVRHLGAGRSIPETACRLGISPHTVRVYANRIAVRIPGHGTPLTRILLWCGRNLGSEEQGPPTE